jgi:hypothetical protein
MKNKMAHNIGLVMVVCVILQLCYLLYNAPNKKQPAITGGLELPPKPETIIKHDSLFNDTDYAGDTACFEMINNHKIVLRCVCPCSEYRKKTGN